MIGFSWWSAVGRNHTERFFFRAERFFFWIGLLGWAIFGWALELWENLFAAPLRPLQGWERLHWGFTYLLLRDDREWWCRWDDR